VDWFYLIFRLVHIVSGILWVGGALLIFLYLEPAATKLGPAAETFMNEIFFNRKLPIYFALASTLTVIAGAALYLRGAGGLALWGGTTGTVLTIGALSAIIAWIGGNAFIPRNFMKLQALGAEAAAAGGPPSADLQTRIHAVQERLRLIGVIDTVLLLVAVIAMESAKYLG
jgi:uncharacterized membrane protein